MNSYSMWHYIIHLCCLCFFLWDRNIKLFHSPIPDCRIYSVYIRCKRNFMLNLNKSKNSTDKMKQGSATCIRIVHEAIHLKWKRLENLTFGWYVLESALGIKQLMGNELEIVLKQLVMAWGLYFCVLWVNSFLLSHWHNVLSQNT